MPNNDQTWQQAAQFVTNCFLMVYQQHQQQYIFNVWQNLNSKPKHALLKSGIDTEKKRAQNLVDQVFEYVAPSLFVTSVLASGELVGSTIWGISKYVSKDIIWNTLGSTTAAVILQSAELVGYRNEVQEFFGIKPAEKRATVAIKMGSKLGQAIGAVAGTSLTLLAEPWLLPVAPVLAPYLPFAGLFIGGVAGDVIGAGLGAGLNNLLLSTIGIVPASYKGIKQKGGQFVERIQNSSKVKRKVKDAKAAGKEQEEAKTNVVSVNAQDTGRPNVLSAPLLLEVGNRVPVEQLDQVSSPAQNVVRDERQVANQQQPVIAQQRDKKQKVVVLSVNEIPGEGGNKTGVENPGLQQAVGSTQEKTRSQNTIIQEKKTSKEKGVVSLNLRITFKGPNKDRRTHGNAIRQALQEGKKTKDKPYAQKPNNTSGQNSQSVGKGRSIK